MKVLVTGGTSPVGAPLVRRLAADGDKVRALLRRSSNARRLDGAEYMSCGGDVRDPYAVASGAYDCDAVIHLAYAPVSASAREILDIAVQGMSSVLRACEIHNIHSLMLVSSPRAEDPDDPYGLGKRVQEQMALAWLQAGVPRRVTCARVYNVYGPGMGTDHVVPQFISRMTSIARLHRKDPVISFPVAGSGDDIRSFLWTEDCTDQLITLFRRGDPGFTSWDVGDLRTKCTMADLAHMIARCQGLDIRIEPTALRADPTVRLPRAERMLAAGPRENRDLASGLEETVQWYRENEKVLYA